MMLFVVAAAALAALVVFGSKQEVAFAVAEWEAQ